MNNDQNYTTGLAHLLLCGSSGWAIKNISYNIHPHAFCAFTFLLGHGILGIIRFTHPDLNETGYIKKLFERTLFLAKIVPLPIFNTQIYLEYKQQDQIAYLHVGSSIIPAITSLISSDFNNKISDVLLLGNLASLAYISVTNENSWAIGMTTLCVFNHFILDFIADHFRVPKVDLFTIGLSFFNIFAVNCLG